MLAASDDLIDMIHTHPFIADGSPQMQFSLVFPRPRMLPRLGAVSAEWASSTPPISTCRSRRASVASDRLS